MAINLNVQGNTQPLEAAVQAAVNRIRKTPIKITVDDKGATQPLGNMKRGADEFSKSMEAANARIIAFGASMAIINGVSDAFKAMVKNVVEVEKALADINVVMGLSATNLDKFSSGLFKVAKETAASFDVAAAAATEYARQGLKVEETLKRTKDALILTRLTGMDSANAVKALTAAMNTYGDQIKDTTQLVSKFAAVDVQFAVSAEDFADAISRTGQAAKSAGVDIDELVGLVTAAQQQTARGGKVIGNSFKTIFTRIGRTDTLNQLENLGIAVRDVEGRTLGAKRILTDLANTFDHLSEAQKAQIAQTVGGVFQINVLKAVLSDAAKQNGILANATQISAGATDEAITKNEQLRQTMAAMASETGLALKEVSAQIGEIMLAPGMERILNIVKSMTEGVGDMLGTGEGAGNTFAKGFLKGLGNIITGPGLVVMVAVFTKLLIKAVQYARDSLKSLIGVTSEAQKQKAIQTSLVTLFGQNAALNKEMLRTDISRTEKEKIILSLLKAQVMEANALNSLTKQMSTTLYSKGYGANLAPRRGKAGGHIPNFADPERQQAARGGYAAGSIRSMNMPGEGSVIYNSAEKVKNFKGMTQPAIMPPHSSKAGKNYQQAFGSIHGFDPYAAGGYIPNYAGWSNAKLARQIKDGKMTPERAISLGYTGSLAQKTGQPKTSASKTSQLLPKGVKYLNPNSINYIGLSASLGPDIPKASYYVAGGTQTSSGIYSSATAKGFNDSLKKGVPGAKVDVEFKALDSSDKQKAFGKMDDEINSDLQNNSQIIANKILNRFDKAPMKKGDIGKDLPKNKMSVVSGHIFEAVTKSVLRQVGAEGAIADGPNDLIDLGYNKELYELFGIKEGEKKGQSGAEAKLNTTEKNVKSLARKIYSLHTGSHLKTKGKTAASGYIPNFANPLSDAIGRERQAGVPVSQIRVGSHPALMNKSNPIGLGVTNTQDEPNGLKDVFGAANGFVPNYAPPQISASNIDVGMHSPTMYAKKYNEKIKKLIKAFESNKISHDQLMRGANNLNQKYSVSASAQTQVSQSLKKMNAPISRMKSSISRMSQAFEKSSIGKAIGSNAGQIGLMMGLPMAGGFVKENIGGAFGSGLGGALQGAGTGASMGMMFGPLGTAIGATAGALYGLTSGIKEAQDSQAMLVAEQNIARQQIRDNKVVTSFNAMLGEIVQNASRINFEAQKNISEQITVFSGLSGAGSSVLGMKDEKTADYLTNSLRAIIASKDSKGGQAANLLGLNIVDFFDENAVEFTKENEGELLDFRDEILKIDKVVEGILNKTITEKGVSGDKKGILPGYGSKFLGGVDPTNIAAEDLDKAREDLKEALLIQLRSTKGGKLIIDDFYKTQKITTSFAKEFQEFYKEAPKTLSESVALLGTLSAKDLEGSTRLASAKSTVKSFISKGLADDSEIDVEIGGKMETVNKRQLLEAVEVADKSADLAKLLQSIGLSTKKILTSSRASADAVILQLNTQKAMITAQRAAYEAQLDIKSKYLKQSNLLDFQEKILGGLISEEQKVRIQYNKNLLKASQAYELGAQAAADDQRKGIIADIGLDKNLQQALKQELFKGQIGEDKKYSTAEKVNTVDLTNKLAAMDAKELLTILTNLNISGDAANKIIENRNLLYDNSIAKLQKQKTLSDGQSEAQKTLNEKIAQQKDLMVDVNREMQNYIRGLDNAAQSRAITSEITAARFASRPRTRGETVSEERRLSGVRQKNIVDDYIKKSTSRNKEIIKAASSREFLEEMFKAGGGESEIKALEEKVSRSGPIANYKELNQQLNQLKTLQESVNAAKREEQKIMQDVSKEIEEQLGSTNEKINREKILQKIREDEYVRRTGPDAFMAGIKDTGIEMENRVAMMDYELGKNIPMKFADGLAQAMQATLNQTENLGDALMGIASNFLQAIQSALLQKAAYQIVGGVGASTGLFSKGGGVRNYSRGGGVPAMVTNGEYVMSGDAVSKYGGAFMHSLNAGGKIPGYANGGAAPGSAIAENFGGGRGFASGRAYQSKAMSSFFYTQSQNVGLKEDEQSLMGVLQEEERKRQEAAAKKAKKKAFIQQLIGTALSAGLSYGMGSLMKGSSAASQLGKLGPEGFLRGGSDSAMMKLPDSSFDFANAPSSFSDIGSYGSSPLSYSSMNLSYNQPSISDFFNRYNGGPIRKYASGGHISGKSGIDQIPAMLSEGEYVIKASSARQLGKPMLDRINAGKYNDGGAVGATQIDSSTPTGNTNNISISINMENGKVSAEEKTQDTNPATSQEGSSEKDQSLLAEKIKQQVVSVIVEEQRPGGLLSE